VGSEQWGRFLIGIFDEWIERDVGKVYVQMFDAALAAWVGLPASMCIFTETCGSALALEHNGDLYSCDHFVEPTYRLGNIQETHMLTLGDVRAATTVRPRQARHAAALLPRVRGAFCVSRRVSQNRFIATPDGEAGLNYLCAGYKAFFMHIDRPMQVMAGLLRQGRYADEAMAVLRQAV
jgi:uncharacterized protein